MPSHHVARGAEDAIDAARAQQIDGHDPLANSARAAAGIDVRNGGFTLMVDQKEPLEIERLDGGEHMVRVRLLGPDNVARDIGIAWRCAKHPCEQVNRLRNLSSTKLQIPIDLGELPLRAILEHLAVAPALGLTRVTVHSFPIACDEAAD